jgi:hypothetical protein
MLAFVCMLQVTGSEIQPTFLHPSGPNKSFMYSSPPNFCGFQFQKCLQKWIQKLQLVAHVISEMESSCPTEKLQTRLHSMQIVTLIGNIFHLIEKTNCDILMNKPAR